MSAVAPCRPDHPAPGETARDGLAHERRFMAAMDAAVAGTDDLAAILARLEDWLASLGTGLAAARLDPRELRAGGALARGAEAVNGALAACLDAWPRQRAALQPASALAGSLAHAAILLVFGKFNAGKSSLCNFIAARFAAAGREVAFFHLEGGHLVESPEGFAEGATETTARLQGVRLGERLVLLDTPGLHSATGANAALTRRFLDSADGVLWLTSSAAPGQVQELDELASELRRGKPLLPVVTRSDVYEEDEIDGALVQHLRNKTPGNRAEQEADVAARTRDKLAILGLDPALLRPPVSISVHMARAAHAGAVGAAGGAMAEAGMERLYAALHRLAGPALAYKRRKPAEVLLRHLDEAVLETLRHAVDARLVALRGEIAAARARLERQREPLEDAVWGAAMALLPGLLEAHAAARDTQAVCRAVSASLSRALEAAVDTHLADGGKSSGQPRTGIHLAADVGFQADADDAGAAVDYGRLHAALAREVRDWVVRETAAELARHAACLDRLAEDAARFDEVLSAHAAALDAIRTALRAARPSPVSSDA